MGIFDIFRMNRKSKPVKIASKWKPGTTLELMSYNEAIGALKSGDPVKMAEAIGSNILNAPSVYNSISMSQTSPSEERLTDILLPLLKHNDFHVRCCIPSVLEVIGDSSLIPFLEDVVSHDPESQVVTNARIAIEQIKSRGVNTDSVKFLRRFTKPIDSTTTGTYEEYRAPNRVVALAFLNKTPVTKDYYYIEVITPEGNLGKDKDSIY